MGAGEDTEQYVKLGLKKISLEKQSDWKMHAYHMYERAVMNSEIGTEVHIILLALLRKVACMLGICIDNVFDTPMLFYSILFILTFTPSIEFH